MANMSQMVVKNLFLRALEENRTTVINYLLTDKLNPDSKANKR